MYFISSTYLHAYYFLVTLGADQFFISTCLLQNMESSPIVDNCDSTGIDGTPKENLRKKLVTTISNMQNSVGKQT